MRRVVPRRELFHTAGVPFHVLNRGARRLRLFEHAADYDAFLGVLEEGRVRTGIRLLTYCVMPNHFHLVVSPEIDGQMTEFMWWFQLTHSKRWVGFRRIRGIGAVYQGRFRAFAVQDDGHLLTVCRYVERNPLRAGLVARAEEWPWSGLRQRFKNCNGPGLATWPILQPPNWLDIVNAGDRPTELTRLRTSLRRNAPFGSEDWLADAASRGLGSLKVIGRPKHPNSSGM
jgi:putative transposase